LKQEIALLKGSDEEIGEVSPFVYVRVGGSVV